MMGRILKGTRIYKRWIDKPKKKNLPNSRPHHQQGDVVIPKVQNKFSLDLYLSSEKMSNKFVGSRRHSSNISIGHQINFLEEQKKNWSTRLKHKPTPLHARLKLNKQVLCTVIQLARQNLGISYRSLKYIYIRSTYIFSQIINVVYMFSCCSVTCQKLENDKKFSPGFLFQRHVCV
jgi:hypothetical protein